MSPPSVKRKLPEDAPSGCRSCKSRKKFSPYQKHEKHWHPDGDVLLQVRDTRFRVHRSRLESESNWFRHLFDYYDGVSNGRYDPQEDIELIADAAHRADDIPLFYLDVVDPEASRFAAPEIDEVSYLLSATDKKTTDYASSLPTMSEIATLYRAAHRYQVKRYQTFCGKYLESTFPDITRRISEPVSIRTATLGLLLGQEFGLNQIRARALHDLARARVPPGRIEMRDITRNFLHSSKKDFLVVEADILTDFAHVTALQKYLKHAWIDLMEELIGEVRCNPTQHRNHYSCQSLDLDTATLFLDTIQSKFPNDPLMGIHECFHGIPAFINFCCSHKRPSVKDLLLKRKEEIYDHVKSNWTERLSCHGSSEAALVLTSRNDVDLEPDA